MTMTASKSVAAALALATLAPMPATAAAFSAVKAPTAATNATHVDQVRYRGGPGFGGPRFYGNRYYGGGYGYRRHRGYGAGPAIVGGLIATAIIAAAIRENRASASDIDRCEAAYKSFDPRTGTYLGYDGVRHVCPYLD